MKISFHIGSVTLSEVNTINFFEINKAELNTLKALTEDSGLLFNAFGEDFPRYQTGTDTEHDLTIYLQIMIRVLNLMVILNIFA